MSDAIRAFHHVSVKASGEEEFQKALSFYRDLLKLPLIRTWGEAGSRGAMLACGDSRVELGTADERLKTGAIRHLALDVDDVDSLLIRVQEAGYEVTMTPRDIRIPSEPPLLARIAFFIGPCGEEIELFSER